MINGRPNFADDVSWARWLIDHPTEITSADREQLRQQMRNSSFRTLLDWEGVAATTLEGFIRLEVEVA